MGVIPRHDEAGYAGYIRASIPAAEKSALKGGLDIWDYTLLGLIARGDYGFREKLGTLRSAESLLRLCIRRYIEVNRNATFDELERFSKHRHSRAFTEYQKRRDALLGLDHVAYARLDTIARATCSDENSIWKCTDSGRDVLIKKLDWALRYHMVHRQQLHEWKLFSGDIPFRVSPLLRLLGINDCVATSLRALHPDGALLEEM